MPRDAAPLRPSDARSAAEGAALAAWVRPAQEPARPDRDRLQTAVERQDAHLVAALAQRLDEGRPEASRLELARPVAVEGVRQLDRGLRVHPPIERGDQGLGDLTDDPAATG